MGLFTRYKGKCDELLMDLMKNGDHRAFTEIYDRYASRLNAFFFRMLWSDKELAQDCVHDLFSRIIERPSLFKDGYLLKPWLFRIAANICKNHYRKKSYENEYLKALNELPADYQKSESKIDEELLTAQLNRHLEGLNEELRTIFLLRYQQELSIKEIAEVFEIAEGTVKSRLCNTKKYLLSMLTDHPKILEDEK